MVAGIANLPHVIHLPFLPESLWLEHQLEAVTELSVRYMHPVHLSAGVEWALIGVATVIAIVGIGAAWQFLKPETLPTAREAPAETGHPESAAEQVVRRRAVQQRSHQTDSRGYRVESCGASSMRVLLTVHL